MLASLKTFREGDHELARVSDPNAREGEVNKVDEGPTQILRADQERPALPLDECGGGLVAILVTELHDSSGTSPSALVLSRRLPPEVDEVTRLELELLHCKTSL